MKCVGLCLAIISLQLYTASGQVVLSGDPGKIPPNPHKKDSQVSGTISMGTPDLSDEDSQSLHMPNYLKCDACRIISARFSKALEKEINKIASIKRGEKELSEDNVLDLLEEICDDSWEQHGIKEVDGVKRLSGPGYETSEVPGVMQGGGKWPFRFKQMCSTLLGDAGEDMVYQKLRKNGASGVEQFLCYSKLEGSKSYCETKGKQTRKKKTTKTGEGSKNKRDLNEL